LRTDLDRLLGEAGFERQEFFYSNRGGLPKKPSLTWQRISGGWLAGKRFSDNIFAIARKASRSLFIRMAKVSASASLVLCEERKALIDHGN
jgi:hypothetical protein